MRFAASRSPGRASIALAVIVAVGLLAACGSPTPEEPVTLSDFAFAPTKIAIQRAQKTVLKLQNTGNAEHNIAIPQLNVSSGPIAPGKTVNLELTAPRGPLKIICSIHEDRGMIAEIAVEQRPTTRR